MKEYNSIPSYKNMKKNRINKLFPEIYAYYKYDGSNMRCEWTPKNGFHKFGSRNYIIDESHEYLGESIPLFMDTYSRDIQDIIDNNKEFNKCERLTFFYEFLGDESFAGFHMYDDPKYIKLFDVHKHKYGFLDPKTFNELFYNLDIAKLVYHGKLTDNFINDVMENNLDLNEGVVCKYNGGSKSKMFKIKTNDYLMRLEKKGLEE